MTRKELLPVSGGAKTKFTTKRGDLFLKIFSKCNSVVQAARAVEISPTTIYRHLKEDPAFAKKFEAAQDLVLDGLETEAYRRGVTGVKKAVYFQGRLVGYEMVYSDRMLEMLLRGRSDKYSNKTSVDVSGSVEHKVDIEDIRGKILEKALSRGVTFENEEPEEADFEEMEGPPEGPGDDQGGDQDE